MYNTGRNPILRPSRSKKAEYTLSTSRDESASIRARYSPDRKYARSSSVIGEPMSLFGNTSRRKNSRFALPERNLVLRGFDKLHQDTAIHSASKAVR